MSWGGLYYQTLIHGPSDDHDKYTRRFNRGRDGNRNSWKAATLPVGTHHRYAVTAEHYTLIVFSISTVKPQWLLYVPARFTFKNYTLCPQSTCMCLVWISEQTAFIPPYSITDCI
jgi:hypothetical protein